jgi:hypothetical protein
MKPLRAQFARVRRPGYVWWSICLGLMAASAALAVYAWQLGKRNRTTELELSQLKEAASRARADAERPSPPLPLPYYASAREMLVQASTPWPTLLAALEATSVPGVTVVNVDYTASEARARVDVAFDRYAAVIELAQKLSVGTPENGHAWRWKLLALSQPKPGENGTGSLEATWGAP